MAATAAIMMLIHLKLVLQLTALAGNLWDDIRARDKTTPITYGPLCDNLVMKSRSRHVRELTPRGGTLPGGGGNLSLGAIIRRRYSIHHLKLVMFLLS